MRIVNTRLKYRDYAEEDRPVETRERLRFQIVIWLMSLAGVAALVLALATEADAHEAPMGWRYDVVCCSNRDCRPTAEREVREAPEGYLLVSTGEVVPYGNRRIKDSPDGLFHVCQQGGNFDSGRILCLYVPPRAF